MRTIQPVPQAKLALQQPNQVEGDHLLALQYNEGSPIGGGLVYGPFHDEFRVALRDTRVSRKRLLRKLQRMGLITLEPIRRGERDCLLCRLSPYGAHVAQAINTIRNLSGR